MSNLDILLDMNYLRGLDTQPRVHGNGFIQLDLTNNRRLHIWGHPDIPRQYVSTPIHDHTFGFDSVCLIGAIMNVRFSVGISMDGLFDSYFAEVRDRDDTVLTRSSGDVQNGYHYSLLQCHSHLVREGDTYSVEPYQVHMSVPLCPSVTLMKKRDQRVGLLPRVFVPVGLNPDNNFNRYDIDVEHLWDIVEEVIT